MLLNEACKLSWLQFVCKCSRFSQDPEHSCLNSLARKLSKRLVLLNLCLLLGMICTASLANQSCYLV